MDTGRPSICELKESNNSKISIFWKKDKDIPQPVMQQETKTVFSS